MEKEQTLDNNSLVSSKLAKVHNVKSPIPKSPQTYNSVLANWQNSVPKLYQYSPNQLQVTIQRKSGELETLTPLEMQAKSSELSARRHRKRSRLPLPVNGHSGSNNRKDSSDSSGSSNRVTHCDNDNIETSNSMLLTIDKPSFLLFEDHHNLKSVSHDSGAHHISKHSEIPNREIRTEDCDKPCTGCEQLLTELQTSRKELEHLKTVCMSAEARIDTLEKFKTQLEQEKTLIKSELKRVSLENAMIKKEMDSMDDTLLSSTFSSNGDCKYNEKSIKQMIGNFSSTPIPAYNKKLAFAKKLEVSSNQSTTGFDEDDLSFQDNSNSKMPKIRNMQIITKCVHALNMSYLCDPQILRRTLLQETPDLARLIKESIKKS